MAQIVYMGTPEFAVPPLERLIASHDVIAVVTQPDRPAGRNRQLQASPVKQLASAYGIPVFQPERLRRPEAVETLRQWPADLFVVAAFGQILPQAVLDMPRLGALNIHASLLPRWRGAAPINAAIRAGDTESGITIMRMDAGLDTGPILTQRAIPLAPDETAQSLHDKLSLLGATLLVETLPGYLRGEIVPQPQNDAQATFAGRIDKAEGRVNWHEGAAQIERTVRAFTPWPGTYTEWNGRQLKILAGQVTSGHAEPGQVMVHDGAVAIGTGDGLFLPARVQLQGKNAVGIADFARGYPDFIGARLA